MIDKQTIIDPGKVFAGQYVPDVPTMRGKVFAGQYVPNAPTMRGKAFAGRYSEHTFTNPNIVIS